MEDLKKYKNLLFLEGAVLTLKNQIDVVNEEFDKLDSEEYNYETATDKEKEVMNRIIETMEYINNVWNLKI